MTIEGSGASRAGGDGIHNEDVYLVREGLGLYVVCDGASDAPAGELAARIASAAVEEAVGRGAERVSALDDDAARALVAEAMQSAIAALEQAEETDPDLRGLSTTITMLLAHGRLGVVGHRGDSRAYLVRRHRASQLTVDDELTEGMPEGEGGAPAFDIFAVTLEPNDSIVLCTDGAEGVLADPVLVRAVGEHSPRVVASRIVSAANRRAPDVDATVVVVRVRESSQPGWLELSRPPETTVFGHRLAPAAPSEEPAEASPQTVNRQAT